MAKPRDRREFVLISVTMPDHPKLASIDSPNAGWLYTCGICWAGEHLTDGLITPKVVERKANVPGRWTKALIAAGLWHAPGHACPRCVQPPAGQVIIHDYLAHQRSRAEADAAREAARIAAEKRWGKPPPQPSEAHAEGIAVSNAEGTAVPNADVMHRQRQRESSLLTLISRLAAGDVGANSPPPAEVVAGWQQIVGPTVDLADEAFAYLVRFGDRPARDERGAWLGWLRKAAERAAANAPEDAPPLLGCGSCDGGWLGFDDELRPRPCPTCRRHLRSVEAS
jgi:hypothetical protein